MNAYPVLNSTTTRSNSVTVQPSTAQLVTALASYSSSANSELDVIALFDREFAWHAQKNQKEAQRHLEAAHTAQEHELKQQVKLYAQMLVKILSLDVAERTADLAERQLRYRSKIYYYPDHL